MGFVYPVTLRVQGKLCLVLGTGEEAERKAAQLASAGAIVRHESAFSPKILDGVFLAILTGQEPAINARVFEECETRGILINCLDDSPHCRFAFPSIHRQGDLTIAVSTNGACPALAVRIRESLGRSFGPEYATFLTLCRLLRQRIKTAIPDFDRRRALWYRLVESPALDLLRAGSEDEARDLARKLVDEEAANSR
jgi:siroheme synthase-like protein